MKSKYNSQQGRKYSERFRNKMKSKGWKNYTFLIPETIGIQLVEIKERLLSEYNNQTSTTSN
jgi:hypothetical protein